MAALAEVVLVGGMAAVWGMVAAVWGVAMAALPGVVATEREMAAEGSEATAAARSMGGGRMH